MLRGKRNWIVVTMAVLTLSAVSLQADFADDFEAGVGNWIAQGTTVSVETTTVSEGLQSMRVESLTTGLAGNAQSKPGGETYFDITTPGTEYELSFDYFNTTGTELYWNITINDAPGGVGTVNSTAQFATVQGEWATVSWIFDMDPTAARGYMNLYPVNSTVGGITYIDGLSLAPTAVEPPPFNMGDANGDGVVSAGDYAAVQSFFGTVYFTSSAVTPEPLTMSILGLGMFGILRRKKL